MSNRDSSRPRKQLDLSGPCLVMGVVNITPDSFSDGGDYLDTTSAVEKALNMQAQGASIIDIGPQSTRPGAKPVDAQQQIDRAVPVIQALAGKLRIPISIDTPAPAVAREALRAGADILNDITGFSDSEMIELAARSRCPVIVMHMKGTPQTMQQDPVYKNVVQEVLQYLLERARTLIKSGVEKEQIILDPGIGFGKTTLHNLMLLKHIDRFVESGYPVLVGASRKRFIGEITGKQEPKGRLFGTNAITAHCVCRGVKIIRVHDVCPAVDTVKMINAIENAQ